MSNSFLNRFVQKLGSLGHPRSAAPALVHVAAFGKHPAWDDHIPDLGLSEPDLIDFKRWLYDGVSRNVDNGEWDLLQKSGQLLPFGHTLLWITKNQWIAARCWQSMDGKGRERYPMIAAASCPDLPLSWVLREAVPSLKTLQEQCQSPTTQAQVQGIIGSTENALRQGVPGQPLPADPMTDSEIFLYFADHADLGPDRQGFLRLLYHIEREAPPVRGPRIATKTLPLRPIILRVPLCADSISHASELWARLLLANPELRAALLVSAPDHGRWLDLMLGIPNASQLYCMRAPAEVVPLTTDVPYTLDAQFGNRINHFIETLRARGNLGNNGPIWP